MSDTDLNFEKVLLNTRSLNKNLKAVSLETIDQMIKNMNAVRETRYEAEKDEIEARKLREEKIKHFREMMQDEGIDLSDLAGVPETPTGKTRSKRAPRPAKYQYQNADGEMIKWTGQGRMPSVIAEGIASGKSLKDYEIEAA